MSVPSLSIRDIVTEFLHDQRTAPVDAGIAWKRGSAMKIGIKPRTIAVLFVPTRGVGIC